jgi:hypothetical protein
MNRNAFLLVPISANRSMAPVVMALCLGWKEIFMWPMALKQLLVDGSLHPSFQQKMKEGHTQWSSSHWLLSSWWRLCLSCQC